MPEHLQTFPESERRKDGQGLKVRAQEKVLGPFDTGLAGLRTELQRQLTKVQDTAVGAGIVFLLVG